MPTILQLLVVGFLIMRVITIVKAIVAMKTWVGMVEILSLDHSQLQDGREKKTGTETETIVSKYSRHLLCSNSYHLLTWISWMITWRCSIKSAENLRRTKKKDWKFKSGKYINSSIYEAYMICIYFFLHRGTSMILKLCRDVMNLVTHYNN